MINLSLHFLFLHISAKPNQYKLHIQVLELFITLGQERSAHSQLFG